MNEIKCPHDLNRLEDAITYAEKIAKIEEQACFLISNEDGDYDNHKKCGEWYRQLVDWLKELKQLREQTR